MSRHGADRGVAYGRSGAVMVRRRSAAVIGQLDLEAVARVAEAIREARSGDRRVFLAGNGGSALAALHLELELVKEVPASNIRLRGLAVSCVCGSPAIVSAFANDLGYGRSFSESLQGTFRGGDVFVGFSVSGSSTNIRQALKIVEAQEGIPVVCGGAAVGKLRGPRLLRIAARSNDPAIVEPFQIAFVHVLSRMLQRG